MIIDCEYYSDNTRISNSAIGWFLKKGPRYYRDMLDGKEEGLKLPQLAKGTMIHEYILQPEDFWNDYIILDYEVPKVKQQKDFCEAYANSLELIEDDKKIAAYKSAYSNSKSSEIVLKEATELCNRYANYIKALRSEKDNRKVISFADLNMLKTIKNNIDNHKKAKELLTDMPGVESHNEFHINWEFPVKTYGLETDESKIWYIWYAPCKSLLDRCIFDHVNKKIILIDLKTTSDVYNFKHSVEEFDYYRQITYYLLAITWYMKDQGIDISDYDCEAYIIAIQTNGNYEVRVFNMFNEEELDSRKDLILSALTELSYHYQTGNWDHTRSYYEEDGTEELK